MREGPSHTRETGSATARRALRMRAGVGASATVVQQAALRLSRIVNDRPALILVRHGCKILRSEHGEWRVGPGEAIALAAGQTFDVENRLSPDGLYEACWLVWDAAVLGPHAAVGGMLDDGAAAHALGRLPRQFGEALERALDAVADGDYVPDAVARQRLGEVLVWLGEHGVRFAPPANPGLGARVRTLIGAAPGQPWTSAQAAGMLAMSESSLRRRLALEGSSFGALLIDARMSQALLLLQASERPIQHIAQEVGYDSASRFAIRFRARFGFAPAALRGRADRR